MRDHTYLATVARFDAAVARAEVGRGKTRARALCRALVYVQALNAADSMNGEAPRRAGAERRIKETMRAEGIECPKRGERSKDR